MNTLTFAVLACAAVLASAKPSGHWDDRWDDGRWDDGSWNDGRWDDGRWDDGSWDDGRWDGRWDGVWDGGHSNVVLGNGAAVVGASAGHASIVGPSRLGLGLGGLGLGVGLIGGVGHGVVVKGPPTVPATIIGPGRTGAVSADGLWGPTLAHGHRGKW